MKKELIICALLVGFSLAAYMDWRDTKTLGTGIHEIIEEKTECEALGDECVMLWEFITVGVNE